jgi:hypothetical protein
MQLRRRPILGSLLTVIAGVVIAVAPFRFGNLLSIIGWEQTLVGPLLGGMVALSGLGAMLLPDFSREFGILAMLMSELSLFGAFGGMLVGLLLGLLGGSLCVSWKPAEKSGGEASGEPL